MIDTISKPATKRPRPMAREPKPASELATPTSTPTAEVEAGYQVTSEKAGDEERVYRVAAG